MSRLTSAAVAAAILALAAEAQAYCPSYSPDSAHNSYNCGVASVQGTNPTTAEWQPIFDLVSQGPAVWGNAGPSVSDIGQGCGHPETLHSVPARFPCELLKGITMQESGWRQFCVPDTPSDEVGGASRTIISFDCGYGVGQVTSGMHAGENPGFDRMRVAGEPTYNLATGTQILADKWKATNCVGDNQPTIIEDWYEATWAYNGLAYVNNPNNPNYDSNRGVWDPNVGNTAPYQEKVFGWIENTLGQWTPTALAYPNPGDVGSGSSPGDLPEPDCASPTDCGNHRNVHKTACDGASSTSSSSGAGGSSASSTAATTSSAGGAGGSTSASSGHGSSATGTGGGDGGSGEHHGCGCRAAGQGGDRTALLAMAGILLALVRRRRSPRH